jgi:hypothetical protein
MSSQSVLICRVKMIHFVILHVTHFINSYLSATLTSASSGKIIDTQIFINSKALFIATHGLLQMRRLNRS